MSQQHRLAGKLAIVTGAASGIGHAATRLFAQEGATVLAVDRPGAAVQAAHEGCERIVPFEQDITQDSAPAAIVAAALRAAGGIDILFNNAGVGTDPGDAIIEDETWDHVFAVNTRAVFRLSREAIPHLRSRAEQTGRARIINTASVMAERTDFGLSAYASSKHAVAGLSKTMALDLGRWGITVNYLLPGAIYTGMTRQRFDQDPIRKVWEKKTALRRLGQPIDVARAALLLASDEADFITGHGLVVDGGLTLRI
ncbi:SDR family NAD(P)-dependent oxidoreductase [Ramlibacter sp. WS9]|uniref:SDR family NAD(P)-dependent oxidoreductase n=1 Tax=Ramlibacter sp. WS9 TaxID=1882741 RepID=UPI0011415F92|nr:SDR family oxidoreductase [Ramlibacter sp. WS9]ROZ68733.1 SDR family oxidoreductase [Ramlibacter sp. WS9]